jgi:selenocysteine lyase/cysteine desulfurase
VVDDVNPDLLAQIRTAAIGDGLALKTPYGVRRLTYADVTASGRALGFLETRIRQLVLPTYANVHTSANDTGAQTNAFREEARTIIEKSVHATEEDVVIFTGSGMTGAIHKLITCMGLTEPCCDSYSKCVRREIAPNRPVVFIGPFEHYSNDLPWRDSVCDVVTLKTCPMGRVDLDDLEFQLKLYQDRPVKIGSFSAASNVTGVLSNIRKITKLLHNHGALSFWDYAAAAPYVPIDMNPADDSLAYKDAIFISAHKFPGGPGASGVLVAKKRLFANKPAVPGGGTVSYVDHQHHRYSSNISAREEGGTPNILGDIRAGLVFQLKERVLAENQDAIAEHEIATAKHVISEWSKNPNIWVLGNTVSDRLGVVSVVISHKGKAVHQGFVAALLNDLFGIQARSGTSCASPYGNLLLNISSELSEKIEEQILAGDGGIRPGWTRISFAYYDSPATVDYIIKAVDLIATEGWRALVDYTFDPKTGHWKHRGEGVPLLSLSSELHVPEYLPESVYEETLREAVVALHGCQKRCQTEPPTGTVAPVDIQLFEAIRWFWLPEEITHELSSASELVVPEEPAEPIAPLEALEMIAEVVEIDVSEHPDMTELTSWVGAT